MQLTRRGGWPLWLVVAGVGFNAWPEPYPLSAQEPKERARFRAHDNRVYALAFTSDGKTLVSGGGILFKRGEVKLWDVAAILKLGGEK
jgi:WD40 repeat protein